MEKCVNMDIRNEKLFKVKSCFKKVYNINKIQITILH